MFLQRYQIKNEYNLQCCFFHHTYNGPQRAEFCLQEHIITLDMFTFFNNISNSLKMILIKLTPIIMLYLPAVIKLLFLIATKRNGMLHPL